MWRKLGLVYVPNGEQPWAASHALVPTTWMPDEDRIRVVAEVPSAKVDSKSDSKPRFS